MILSGKLTAEDKIIGEISTKNNLTGNIAVSKGYAEFGGFYEITASDEVQTIPVGGLLMRKDITINPIPNNYGRISWNGAELFID